MDKRILVVAAHPDDEVLGCGGTIARHSDDQDIVDVLIISRGVPEIFPQREIERTRAELKSAHAILGVHETHFLDFPAPKLDVIALHELIDAISSTIRAFRPEIVYSHHWGDIHADHQVVFNATLVASRPINDCPVRRILAYETLSETEWARPVGEYVFTPTIFMNISNYLEKKLQAMACYGSQLKQFPHPRSVEALRALAILRGSTVGFQAAEAFELVRDIVV